MVNSKPGVLMIQGTGSDVGKSVIVAGLCRVFSRRGMRVRPFKPQNMSNNAAVTPDGGEIGRAQALQARACYLEPSRDMNPVLLKPETDRRAQIVVQGSVLGSSDALDYGQLKAQLLGAVMESYNRLCEGADLVLIEGAGSPAEVNLRERDIANFGFATNAHVPVVLLGDIDRGGVIASLVGTWAVIEPEERALVRAFIINKFRGDLRLFEEGVRIIERRTGWRGLGVIPYLSELRRLPAEDALPLDSLRRSESALLRIAVPILPRISNFDDLDPLSAEPGVSVNMIPPGRPLPGDADLVIIPGSKSTLYDLAFFRDQGWDIDLAAHHRRGGWILGICAGYQMLGRRVYDPEGLEGGPRDLPGLGYLDIETTINREKVLGRVAGHEIETGHPFQGYEIHMGRITGAGCDRPWLQLESGPEGVISGDGRVRGTSVHGLFTSDAFRRSWLKRLGLNQRGELCFEHEVESTLDRLADQLESSLDLKALLEIAAGKITE
jgi:adenosylcobyric acid synthase